MTRTSDQEEEGREREREQMLHCADVRLQDGENTSVSQQTRLCAIFDSIYIRLMLARAGEPESTDHPSMRVILAGAEASGLDDESVEEVLELYGAVVSRRYKPWTYHPINLLHALALAQSIAKFVRR